MKLTDEEIKIIKFQSEKIFNLMSNGHDLDLWLEIDQLLGYTEQFGNLKIDSIDVLLSMDVNRYLEYVEWVTKILYPSYGENQLGLQCVVTHRPFVLLSNNYAQTLLKEYNKKYSKVNPLIMKSTMTSVDLCQLKIKKTLTLHDVENYIQKLFINMKSQTECLYKTEFNKGRTWNYFS